MDKHILRYACKQWALCSGLCTCRKITMAPQYERWMFRKVRYSLTCIDAHSNPQPCHDDRALACHGRAAAVTQCDHTAAIVREQPWGPCNGCQFLLRLQCVLIRMGDNICASMRRHVTCDNNERLNAHLAAPLDGICRIVKGQGERVSVCSDLVSTVLLQQSPQHLRHAGNQCTLNTQPTNLQGCLLRCKQPLRPTVSSAPHCEAQSPGS